MIRNAFWTLGLFSSLVLLSPDSEARGNRRPDTLRSATETTVAAPLDEETCFSPDEPCAAKLVNFIDSAQQSIDIAIYDINLDQLVHHLLVKSKKIPVRIVVDRRQARGQHSLVPLLVKAGARVRFGHQRGIMHNKFAIIDGKRLELGSFNYTNHASTANNENQLYLAIPAVVARYRQRFETIWNAAEPVDIRSLTGAAER